MKKILFGIILVTIFNLAIFAQQTPQAFAVKTDNGVAIVYNNGNKSFAFEIFGKEIQNVKVPSDGMFFMVDGKPLQISFPKLKDVLGNQKITDGEKILKTHQIWELDFQSKNVFKQKVTAENEAIVFLNLPKGKSHQTFFWTFTRPENVEKTEFNADAFQSTLVGDTLLVVGSPLAPNQDITAVRRFFNGTLSTLTFLDKPITPNVPKPATTKPKVKAKVKSKK